jgi:ribosomal protein L40E
MYFNFKAVSDINNMLSLLSGIGGYPYGYGFPSITLDSIWIIFFGFLLLGISGIIGLVTACLPLAISAKQLSTRLEAPRPKTPEGAPAKPSEVKYCTKCGASMPLDAIYCLKCGQKQPKEEEI